MTIYVNAVALKNGNGTNLIDTESHVAVVAHPRGYQGCRGVESSSVNTSNSTRNIGLL